MSVMATPNLGAYIDVKKVKKVNEVNEKEFQKDKIPTVATDEDKKELGKAYENHKEDAEA